MLFFNNAVFGQLVKIVNEVTLEPVENVALYSRDKSVSAISNQYGEVNLSRFATSDSLCFQHSGYEHLCTTRDNLLQNGMVKLRRRNVLIEEFVISAYKLKEQKQNVPYRIDIINASQLKTEVDGNSADVLEQTGNIAIQKSQGGGGSPIIRGFEANRVLLVVDGVRLNNAIFRSGHLQNALTIDNLMLDRVEVLYGPGSTVYGSDAIGGVVHYFSRDPELSLSDSLLIRANAIYKYATATNSHVSGFGFNLGGNRLASLTHVSYKHFGDITMGSFRNPYYEDYGKVPFYAKELTVKILLIRNSNALSQPFTGYNQIDLLQKFIWKPYPNSYFTTNIQYSTSGKLHRTETLNDWTNTGHPEFAEWYYGPQNRLLVSQRFTHDANRGIYDELIAQVAFQDIDEERVSRQFNSTALLTQHEDLQVYAVNIDMYKDFTAQHRLNYGCEATYNQLSSAAFGKDIMLGSTWQEVTRYPNGNNYTFTVSGYLAHRINLNKAIKLTSWFALYKQPAIFFV
ncbi:MAG: TonB-dependent receptor plug domain-containing protein [Bacteroidales bacterium]|nr:TonB-dependent receptor plug domain-containing protein [Bacteroidales bacterium]